MSVDAIADLELWENEPSQATCGDPRSAQILLLIELGRPLAAIPAIVERPKEFVERIESAKLQQDYEAEVESRRHQAPLHGSHRRSDRQHQMGRNALSRHQQAPGRHQAPLIPRSSRHQGRRDFLGYYKILGVEAGPQDTISTEQIKAAFKKLQMAYDVLKDAEKRRSYDGGRLMEH
eukprot:gene8734-33596_t